MSTTGQTPALQTQMAEQGAPLAEKAIATESKVTKKAKPLGNYYQAVLARRIALDIKHVGRNVREILETVANQMLGGKCGAEGYVRPGSVKVLAVGAPTLKADRVVFQVSVECLICNPVEGMIVNAVVRNVTKAGIRAEVPEGANGETTPMVIFVQRDHHFNDAAFSNLHVDDSIQVKVIGSRFKFNDKYVSVVAQLVDKPSVVEKPTRARTLKKKLVIKPN